MEKLSDEMMKTIMTGIIANDREELLAMKKEELEDYWFFHWNNNLPLQYNLYEFFKMLDIYSNRCEEWETLHNGHICVVERVRDQYLMPKLEKLSVQILTKQ